MTASSQNCSSSLKLRLLALVQDGDEARMEISTAPLWAVPGAELCLLRREALCCPRPAKQRTAALYSELRVGFSPINLPLQLRCAPVTAKGWVYTHHPLVAHRAVRGGRGGEGRTGRCLSQARPRGTRHTTTREGRRVPPRMRGCRAPRSS